MIGATMIAIPHRAIAFARCARGNASSSTVCDRGINTAPNAPCKSRKTTIDPKLHAAPHSTEVKIKPAIEVSNKLRRPKRADSTPVSGITTAVEIM